MSSGSPIVRLEFDQVTPSLNVWQRLHWSAQHGESKAWEERINKAALLAGAVGLPRAEPGQRRVVVAHFTHQLKRDDSNTLGPFNKCATDHLRQRVQRQEPLTKTHVWVEGALPVLYDDDPAHCLEIVTWTKGHPAALVVEVWEQEDWRAHES